MHVGINVKMHGVKVKIAVEIIVLQADSQAMIYNRAKLTEYFHACTPSAMTKRRTAWDAVSRL
jgi:hypothetical protein